MGGDGDGPFSAWSVAEDGSLGSAVVNVVASAAIDVVAPTADVVGGGCCLPSATDSVSCIRGQPDETTDSTSSCVCHGLIPIH